LPAIFRIIKRNYEILRKEITTPLDCDESIFMETEVAKNELRSLVFYHTA